VPADQMKGPKGLGDEIDPVERSGKLETGVIQWKRGRCGRMCRDTSPLDAPSQQKFVVFRKFCFLGQCCKLSLYYVEKPL